MKGIIWLASGLMLSLLLVSGVSVGSQFAPSWPNHFFVAQDLKFVGQATGRAWGRVDQSLDSQFTFLNNSAAVVSTWDAVSGWFNSLVGWLGDLWLRFIKPAVTSAQREQIKQELLAELKSQGLINADLSLGEVGGTKYGIMVAPATGSTTRDEWLKKSLSRMFADQVDLKFDQSGMSGIVTPTFKDGRKGGDYIFVLTPLR